MVGDANGSSSGCGSETTSSPVVWIAVCAVRTGRTGPASIGRDRPRTRPPPYSACRSSRRSARCPAPSEAHALGLAKLLTYVTTETAGAGRLARHTTAILEPELAGHERVVTLPAYGRCMLLAGRLYAFSTGFLRHPRCDCDMRPGNTPRGLLDPLKHYTRQVRQEHVQPLTIAQLT